MGQGQDLTWQELQTSGNEVKRNGRRAWRRPELVLQLRWPGKAPSAGPHVGRGLTVARRSARQGSGERTFSGQRQPVQRPWGSALLTRRVQGTGMKPSWLQRCEPGGEGQR